MDNYSNPLDRKAEKKEAWKEKWRWGFVAIIVVAVSILLFFMVFRFTGFSDFWNRVISALSPIIFGLVIAYLINPIVEFWQKLFLKLFNKMKNERLARNLSRGIAIALSLTLFVLAIVGLLWAVIPALVQSVSSVANNMPKYVETIVDWIENIKMPDTKWAKNIESTLTSMTTNLEKWLETNLLPQAQTYLTSLTTGVISVAKGIFNFIIGIIVAIYVLSIKDTLKGQSKKIIYAVCRPKHANIVLTTIRKSSDIFGGFISGKIIDSAIIGIICYVGCLLLKIPQPMLIAVIIGVTNIIPVFGPFIGAIPTLFLVVIENPVQALYLLIFIIILQQVDGNIIGPKILGNSTGLSTFWVMFAILIGSGLFGFLGMLLGVPIFGVVYYIIKQLVAYGVRRRHLSDNTVDYINADHVDPDTLEIIPIDPMAKERERQREIEEAKSVLVKKVEEKIAEIRSGDHSESNDESKDDESKDE